jgi:hypothetical protein
MPRVYCVMPASTGWQLREQSTFLAQHDTKALAVEHGLRVAKNHKPSQLVIYSVDGDIESEWTCLDHPYPPAA